MNLLVLKSNIVCCSTGYTNGIEITNFINIFKFNAFCTSGGRFLPKTPTQNRLPVSRFPPNAYSTKYNHRPHHTLLCIYCYQCRHHQNWIYMFPHYTNGALMWPSVTDFSYYIKSVFILKIFSTKLWVVDWPIAGPEPAHNTEKRRTNSCSRLD